MKTILSSLAALLCSVCFGFTGNQETFTPIDLSKAALFLSFLIFFLAQTLLFT